MHVAPPASPGAHPATSLSRLARQRVHAPRGCCCDPIPVSPGIERAAEPSPSKPEIPLAPPRLAGCFALASLPRASPRCGQRSTRVDPTLPFPQRLSSCRSHWPPSLVDRPCATRNDGEHPSAPPAIAGSVRVGSLRLKNSRMSAAKDHSAFPLLYHIRCPPGSFPDPGGTSKECSALRRFRPLPSDPLPPPEPKAALPPAAK